MRITLFLFSVCLMLSPVAWGQGSVLNSTSESIAEVDTTNTTTVTQQVNSFQTELKARLQGGTYLFDQTYNVAFNNPSITAAIAQAKTVLSGAGAVSFNGPTQLSSTQSTSSSTSTVSNGNQTTVLPQVTTYIGPQTIFFGDHGICATLAIAQASGTTNACSTSATPLSIVAGGQDIDTLVIQLVTMNQTTTTTNTTLTSQVYEIDGFAAGVTPPTATPAPRSLLLILIGLAGAGLFAAFRRGRPGFSDS